MYVKSNLFFNIICINAEIKKITLSIHETIENSSDEVFFSLSLSNKSLKLCQCWCTLFYYNFNLVTFCVKENNKKKTHKTYGTKNFVNEMSWAVVKLEN